MNSSIWPRVGTLTSTTTPGHCRSGSNHNEGVLHISTAPELEVNHQMQLSIIPRDPFILVGAAYHSAKGKAYSGLHWYATKPNQWLVG